MTPITLGDLLHHHRKKAGLTQKQLAKAMAFDHTMVSKAERGKLLPSPEFIQRFVQIKALSLTADERQVIFDKYREERERQVPPLAASVEKSKAPGNKEIAGNRKQPTQKRHFRLRLRSHWLAASVILVLLFAASLTFSLLRPPHALTQTRQQPPDGHLIVKDTLQLSAIAPAAGQPVTVTVHLQNQSSKVIHLLKMETAVRGPQARALGWQAPQEDFPGVEYITLQPGEEYIYTQTRSFALPGDYFAEPVRLDEKGRWGGILPYVRVWFTVTETVNASTSH